MWPRPLFERREGLRGYGRVPAVPRSPIGQLVPVVLLDAVAVRHDDAIGPDLIKSAPERRRLIVARQDIALVTQTVQRPIAQPLRSRVYCLDDPLVRGRQR